MDRPVKQLTEGHEAADDEAAQVAAFLRQHPQFLIERPELLSQLELAVAPSGAASLASRQVAALREQNHELRGRMRELIAVARANDALAASMHALALTVLRVASPDALEAACAHGLAGPAGVEPPLAVHAFGPCALAGARWWHPPEDARAAELASLMQAAKPVCGRFKQAQLAALFGTAAAGVGSAVVAPIAGAGWRGLLAVGHPDSRHYHPEMGVELLAHVAACIGVRIDTWCEGRSGH